MARALRVLTFAAVVWIAWRVLVVSGAFALGLFFAFFGG